MSDVIDELSEDNTTIDKAHIERRLADWVKRVAELYQIVRAWLPPELSLDERQSIVVKEEMMARFGVKSIELPVASITNKGEWVGKLVPKGLWIIGANGRVDMFVGNSQYLLVDRAENFHPASWFIASALERGKQQRLSEDSFRKALLN